MGKIDWNQFPDADTARSSKVNWDQFPDAGTPANSGFDPSAFVQGAGNFAAAGYVPELTGAVGKMIPDPGAGTDAQLKAKGFTITQPAFNGETTDDSRAMQKQMAADSPYSYYGGGAVGAIASAPVYGAALKGAGIAKTIAPAAADAGFMAKAGNLVSRGVQAGKEGAAISFASNPNTQVGDSGFNLGQRGANAAVGGLVTSAIPVAGDLIKGGASAAKWGGTKLLSNFGGVNPQVINEYAQFSNRINSAPSVDALKNISDEAVGKLAADVDANKLTVDQAQDAYKGLQSDLKDAYRTQGYDARDAVSSAQQTVKDAHSARIQQVAGDVYDTVNQLKSDVVQGSKDALNTLDKSRSVVDLNPTYDQIDASIAKAKAAGTDESNAVADKLQAYKDRLLEQHGEEIFGNQAKKLIQGLDQTTKYSPMAGAFDDIKNAAFKDVRSSMDQTLKNTDVGYQKAMEPVAENTKLLTSVQDFGDKQSAIGFLKSIGNLNQTERRFALDQLGKKYSKDFVSAVDPANLPEQARLNKALAIQDSLRPDRVATKLEQSLASSRQASALDTAQSGLASAQEKLAPFKSLAPNPAGQTQAQQKLIQLGTGKNIELTDMFQKLGKLTGTDFVQAMKDQNTLAAFQKGATNGSRNTLMGGIVGWLFGGVGGMAGGAAAGRAVDQWGPAMTKKILDGAIAVSKNPTVVTISGLQIPDAAKQNMMQGLKNYIANQSKSAARLPGTGNGASQDQSNQASSGMVRVQAPDGTIRLVPNHRYGEAIANGGNRVKK